MNRSQAHTKLVRAIRLAVSKGWPKEVVLWQLKQGHGQDSAGHHFPLGLIPGASDLIGIAKTCWQHPNVWDTCIVEVGRFIALEAKTGKGRPSKDQISFLRLINRMGGYACIVRSVEEAEVAIENALEGREAP